MRLSGPAFTALPAKHGTSQSLDEVKWHSTPPAAADGYHVVANQPEADFMASRRGVPGVCVQLFKEASQKWLPGESLKGAVVMTLSLASNLSMLLEFSGTEFIAIVPRRSVGSGGRTTKTAAAAPSINADVAGGVSEFTAGRYTWMFEIDPLPIGAPASVSAESVSGGAQWASVSASVTYVLHLIATVSDGRTVQISYTVPVGAASAAEGRLSLPATASRDMVLPRSFFCGAAGAVDVLVTVQMPRLAAASSAPLLFTVRATPRDGAQARSARASLVRVLRRRGAVDAGQPLASWPVAFTDVRLAASADVGAHALSADCSMPLPGTPLQPSCEGALFAVSYELRVIVNNCAAVEAVVIPVLVV